MQEYIPNNGELTLAPESQQLDTSHQSGYFALPELQEQVPRLQYETASHWMLNPPEPRDSHWHNQETVPDGIAMGAYPINR